MLKSKLEKQAFSHWTLNASEETLIITDLQGVLMMVDDLPVYNFTDPQIHTIHGGNKSHGLVPTHGPPHLFKLSHPQTLNHVPEFVSDDIGVYNVL